MIFKFWELKILKQHFSFLKSKINTSNFFLVGGSIRDILLWLTTNPEDVDFTMPGNPQRMTFSFYDWKILNNNINSSKSN